MSKLETVFIRPDESEGFLADVVHSGNEYMVAASQRSGQEFFIDLRSMKVICDRHKYAQVFFSRTDAENYWTLKFLIEELGKVDVFAVQRENLSQVLSQACKLSSQIGNTHALAKLEDIRRWL